MEKKLIISPSPHVQSRTSTTRLMGDVLLALAPAMVISIIVHGWGTLLITGVAVAACILFEYLIQRMLGRRNSIGDLSAVLTGVLLAFNLPSTLPLWMVVLGALVAIGIGKMSFGGLGTNPFNPALVGRVFLLISFPVDMTTFPTATNVDALGGAVDATTGPTLLSWVKEALGSGQTTADIASQINYTDILLGFKMGSFGEIASLALLLGFAYLLFRKVITWHIPVYVLGSMALFSGILWAIDPLHYMSPMFHIFTGGALLGAIFMATDYVTSPMTKRGMAIYGIGIGVITILIRVWGAYPEGISFAILIMNAVVPLLNMYAKPKRFGEVKSPKVATK